MDSISTQSLMRLLLASFLSAIAACGGSSPDPVPPALNQAPQVNAGQNQTASIGSSVTVSATATDDGLPSGSRLTYQWSQSSGAGTAQFVNSTSATTSVSFSDVGTYGLTVTVSDGSLQDSDVLSVDVVAQNQAPVVDAGPAQSIVLPAVARLAGSVTDDGLPVGQNLSFLWSMVNGPGAVQFSTPDALVTTASFSVDGVYQLSLTASDGALSGQDFMQIDVQPAPISAPSVGAATFIGGDGLDGESLRHCLVSTAGDLILGGSGVDRTPVTANAYQTSFAGGAPNGDTWIGRMPTDLSQLTHATFIGSFDNEREAYNVAEKANGQIVFAGHTDSPDYPTTAGTFDESHNGGPGDGFASILSADLSTLVASTYIGGSLNDTVRGDLILDADESVWLLANGESNDYPALNGFQNNYGGGPNEGYISRMTSDLSGLVHSTFFGGDGFVYSEFVQGGILRGDRLTFFGTSPSKQFLETHRTLGDLTASDNDSNDLFVGRISFAGTPTLEWFRFFAGPGSDQWAENGIAEDAAGDLYFTAITHGDGLATPGAFDTKLNGPSDCMIVKIGPEGQHRWTTYLGGAGDDHCLAPTMDANGNLIVVGQTNSANFPVTADALDQTHNGQYDAFVAVINPTGTDVLYASFFGGPGDEFFRWACPSPDRSSLYAVGWSQSANFPVTQGSYQPVFGGGGQDMIVVRLDNIAQ